MSASVTTLLLLILALQAKHFICDGPLQTLRMVHEKSIYLKPQGLLHGLIHAVGTALVLLAFQINPTTVLLFAAADGFIHYHIDFTKENIVRRFGWTVSEGPFWWAYTADQMMHHMTYVILAALALKP